MHFWYKRSVPSKHYRPTMSIIGTTYITIMKPYWPPPWHTIHRNHHHTVIVSDIDVIIITLPKPASKSTSGLLIKNGGTWNTLALSSSSSDPSEASLFLSISCSSSKWTLLAGDPSLFVKSFSSCSAGSLVREDLLVLPAEEEKGEKVCQEVVLVPYSGFRYQKSTHTSMETIFR